LEPRHLADGCVTLFRSEGGFGAMPTAEFDGEAESVLHVYDPFDP